jgi:hypothetical protein
MNPLKRFFDDKDMMRAWADFIVATLNEEALRRVYKGEGTAAIKEASDILDKAFTKLARQFTVKPKPRKGSRAV